MPNISFRMLLTKVSSQHVHVPMRKITGQLCNNLTTIVEFNQFSLTSKENATLPTEVNIGQKVNDNTSTPKDADIQAPDSCCKFTSIPDVYTTYRGDFICFARTIEVNGVWTYRLHNYYHPHSRIGPAAN